MLEELKKFSLKSTKDLIMPTRLQKGDTENLHRQPDVYLMRLPEMTASYKKAPYIMHQAITSKDIQEPGKRSAASCVVRSIFCVYHEEEEEGGLMLLNLMERLRISLLKQVVLAERYELDLTAGLETLVYPDDTAPYFMGEMASVWKMPSVEREVSQWL